MCDHVREIIMNPKVQTLSKFDKKVLAVVAAGLFAATSAVAAPVTGTYVGVNDGVLASRNNVNGEGASGRESVAIGVNAVASNQGSLAFGTNSQSTENGSVAFGSYANAAGRASTAVGNYANSSANTSTAVGTRAQSSGNASSALGSGAVASGNYSVATGAAAQASGAGSVANGLQAKATGGQAVAIGRNAQAADDYSVALGTNAVTAAPVGTDSATVAGQTGSVTYSGFAGTAPVATVSVGGQGAERTVTNVAAGRINAASTDAINGSQLYAVGSQLYDLMNNAINQNLNNSIQNYAFADDAGNTLPMRDGEQLGIKGGTTNGGGKNITTTLSGNNLEVSLNPNVDLGAGGSVKAGNTTLNNNGLTIGGDTGTTVSNDGLRIAGGPSVTSNGIDAGNKTITNVAPGVNGTDAVNVNQLREALNNNAGDFNNRINDLEDDLRAGIAGANALAFLQRANEPGKSLVSAAVGGYRDQQALAVGYARNSDNNKWSTKIGVGVNTKKDINWGGSIGYQW